jgi:hypothetical protein
VKQQALTSCNIISWIACFSESSRIYWDESQLCHQSERLWDLFVQTPFHKTQSCCTMCHRFHETQSLNHCGRKFISFVAFLGGDTHKRICSVCRTNYFLTDVSSLVPILSSFCSVSTRLLRDFFYFLQRKELLKIISSICNLCLVNTHMRKLFPGFMVKLTVGTVFRVCLVKYACSVVIFIATARTDKLCDMRFGKGLANELLFLR